MFYIEYTRMCGFRKQYWITIRYDTIEEINVDSKAEYTA